MTLLTEKVYEKCNEEIKIIFENTDGAMYRIHRSDYDNLIMACNEVEDICKIPLETQVCKTIIARDVNNYINIISDDNIKFKGCFEIDRDFHKNHSKRIVPIALANYYIYNKDVISTIKNHINGDEYSFAKNYGIFDFCLGAKMKGQNILYQRYIEGFKVIDKELSKMTRYYVSNDGVELIKKLPPLDKDFLTETEKQKLKSPNQMNIFDVIEDDTYEEPKDRETNIESGWKCTIFNKYIDDDYDINYDYYINECYKIINAVKNE